MLILPLLGPITVSAVVDPGQSPSSLRPNLHHGRARSLPNIGAGYNHVLEAIRGNELAVGSAFGVILLHSRSAADHSVSSHFFQGGGEVRHG